MTGGLGNDRCYFCGGGLVESLATIPFVVGSSVVIIKQVPAEVCSQCDEAIMSGEVAETVDSILKQARQSGFEVSIVAYDHAMLAAA